MSIFLKLTHLQNNTIELLNKHTCVLPIGSTNIVFNIISIGLKDTVKNILYL